jgi:spore germination protein YaaH
LASIEEVLLGSSSGDKSINLSAVLLFKSVGQVVKYCMVVGSYPNKQHGSRRQIAVGAWVKAIAALSLVCAIAATIAIAENSANTPGIHYRHSRAVDMWLPYWTDKNGDGDGWKDVQRHADELDEVSFFAFSADPTTGDLTNEGLDHGMKPQTIVEQVGWLHTRDVAALCTVTQFDHVGEMLSEPQRLQHLINSIVDTVTTYGFDGVDVDFEDFKAVAPGESEQYTDFIQSLSIALHAKVDSFGMPMLVEATVLPHTDRGTFAFVDFNSLAKTDVDRIRVMSYDENYSGSKIAGASAPAPWVASVATYLGSLDVPQWKFVLGVPGYGYRWPVVSGDDWTTMGKGYSVTYPAAQSLMTAHKVARKWSDDQRSPYFNYTVSGQTWVAFYEDAESWQTKLQTVLLPSQLGGVVVWAAGFEDPDSWPVIDANLATGEPVYGAVGTCYWRYGGGARLGSAVEKEYDAGVTQLGTLNGRAGREQDFENGNIYYEWGKPRAFVVDGNILAAYKSAGGPAGTYGFPISDAALTANGATSQQFERGTISD